MIDYSLFERMEPMKYYDSRNLEHPKAKTMINNFDDGHIALEKRDGEWARVIIYEDKVLIQSRSVSKITGAYGNKTDLIPHIVKELKENYPPGTVLLGELAFEDPSTTSRDVGTILRCKAPKAIARQKDCPLHFYAFDCLAYGGESFMDKAFKERFQLKYISPSSIFQMRYPHAKYLHFVDYALYNFMGFFERQLEQGAEGIVIVKKTMMYEPGKRKSWETLKVKKSLEEIDMKVIGTIEPKMHYEGKELSNWKYWADADDRKVIEWKNPFGEDYAEMTDGMMYPVTKPYYFGWKNGVIVEYEGRTIKVTSGLTDEERSWLASREAEVSIANESLYAAITGMELTEDSIRHPVFIGFKHK